MSYLLLFLFGVAVGTVSGILGIGGGIILVPGLILLFGLTQPEAQGTSLAVLIPPIGIFAALIYYQHGYVRVPVATWVAIGFVVGACIGAKLVPHVPMLALRVGFGAMLLYSGFAFVLTAYDARPATALPAALASGLAILLAWLLRRSAADKRAPPAAPDDRTEYHI